VFRIHGPFLFGAAEKVQEIADEIDSLAPIVILRLRNMTAIDATGLLTLEELADKLLASDRALLVCGARPQPAELFRQAKFEQHIGASNICPNIDAALERAKAIFTSPRPARRSA
jgi:SulP family sulfate permease